MVTGWLQTGTSRSGAQAGTAPGVVVGSGGALIATPQGHQHCHFGWHGPSIPSDLGARAGVAHWGMHGGVGVGPGGCASSDALQGWEQQPHHRFASQGLSVSVGALSNAHFEVAGMWLDVQ